MTSALPGVIGVIGVSGPSAGNGGDPHGAACMLPPVRSGSQDKTMWINLQ
jgi:hypothetical protein